MGLTLPNRIDPSFVFYPTDCGAFGDLFRKHSRIPDVRHQGPRQQDQAHTDIPAAATVDWHKRGKETSSEHDNTYLIS